MTNVSTVTAAEERDTAPLPLAGIRVIDLTRAWAGPSCTAFLGELGADVIKVEAPAGEGMRGGGRQPAEVQTESGATVHSYNLSATFNHINRNKRAIAIDLAVPAGRDVLLRLAEHSDCVVENFRPGVMERLNLAFEELVKVNPRIVLASNGGYGHSGPYSSYRGYGVAIEPMSGLFSVTGYPGDKPQRSGVDHPDPQAGMSMATALLVAIFQSRRTGRGQHVKTSLLRAMAACFAPRVIEYLASGDVPTRHGNDSESFSPHGVYRCSGDDAWVTLAVTDQDEWAALCDVIGRPELASDEALQTVEGRRDRRELIDDAITAWTSTLAKGDAEARLQDRGVAAAAVQSVADLLADEQLASREFIRTVEHAEWGARPYLGPRMHLDGRTLPVGPAPMFGEHRDDILRGLLGMSEDEADELDSEHVVPRNPWRPA